MNDRITQMVDQLNQSYARLEKWRQASSGSYSDRLDATTLTGSVQLKTLGLVELTSFVAAGNRVVLNIKKGGFEVDVSAEPNQAFRINVLGTSFEDAFEPEAVADARRAVENNVIDELFRLAGELRASVHISLQVDPSTMEFHWARTEEAVLVGADWLDTCKLLLAPAAHRRLIIQSALGQQVLCNGLVIHGPDRRPDLPIAQSPDVWKLYSEQWLAAADSQLPVPTAVFPLSNIGLEGLSVYLSACATGLSWAWLASSIEVGAKIKLRFEGAPSLDVDLTTLPPAGFTAGALALVQWATTSVDAGRREAVLQAISTTVSDPTSLVGSELRVLRMARVLYKLSQKTAVAEALASTRDAIAAARDASSSAADMASTATRSAFDRVFTEILAAAGLILANATSILNASVARLLFVFVAVLALATGLSAFLFDYWNAARLLKRIPEAIKPYSEWLLVQDRELIERGPLVESARTTIRTGRLVTFGLVVAVLLTVGYGYYSVK